MLADDNRDAIEALGALLTYKGHTVRLAYNGHSALLAMADRCPDLALLDIGMPDMNGYDVAKAIRDKYADHTTYLIALTGYGQLQDRKESTAAGFNKHLVKPLNFTELDEIIENL